MSRAISVFVQGAHEIKIHSHPVADRRLVFSVFARPEMLQQVTVEAGSDQEEILADGVKKEV